MPVDVAPLVVEQGTLRLVRKMAAFAYGKREVTWPEGYEGPETKLPDDRLFGYVAALPGGEKLGLSERRFVRGDVQIDAVEKWSNVERVLDDAASRTGGEVFVESLIEGRGLGRQVPGEDFRVGQRVPARVCGRVLPSQLVTVVEWHDGNPAVKIGGQEWQNALERVQRNDSTVRAIVNERRQREKALQQEAERRQEAAEREANAREIALANESAARVEAMLAESQARKTAISDQRSYIDGEFQSRLEGYAREQVSGVKDTLEKKPWTDFEKGLMYQLAGSGRGVQNLAQDLAQITRDMSDANIYHSTSGGLIPAYVKTNSALWKMQGDFNEATTFQISQTARPLGAIAGGADGDEMGMLYVRSDNAEFVAQRRPVPLKGGKQGWEGRAYILVLSYDAPYFKLGWTDVYTSGGHMTLRMSNIAAAMCWYKVKEARITRW